MVHATQQLDASLERVRRARERLIEASGHLTQTRQQAEQDPRLERVRQARERLHGASERLTNATGQATDD